MPANPLRRLSVVLGLAEAYEPAVKPVVPPTTATSLKLFLETSKANYLKDVQEDPTKAAEKWIVVMGNEAGGVLSISFTESVLSTETMYRIQTLTRLQAPLRLLGFNPRSTRNQLYLSCRSNEKISFYVQKIYML